MKKEFSHLSYPFSRLREKATKAGSRQRTRPRRMRGIFFLIPSPYPSPASGRGDMNLLRYISHTHRTPAKNLPPLKGLSQKVHAKPMAAAIAAGVW
jgi:hypothetical protein